MNDEDYLKSNLVMDDSKSDLHTSKPLLIYGRRTQRICMRQFLGFCGFCLLHFL